MIEKFFSYYEGIFNNCMQAMTNPSQFAMIEVIHKKLDSNRFECIQQYYVDKVPYLKNIVEVHEQDQKILLKFFKEDGLTYLQGCDTIFQYNGTDFHGVNVCNECYVQKGQKNTFVTTERLLGDGYYHTIDKGLDVETHEQVWGSYNGFFEFVKTPL